MRMTCFTHPFWQISKFPATTSTRTGDVIVSLSSENYVAWCTTLGNYVVSSTTLWGQHPFLSTDLRLGSCESPGGNGKTWSMIHDPSGLLQISQSGSPWLPTAILCRLIGRRHLPWKAGDLWFVSRRTCCIISRPTAHVSWYVMICQQTSCLHPFQIVLRWWVLIAGDWLQFSNQRWIRAGGSRLSSLSRS